jgi:hypothetical protein
MEHCTIPFLFVAVTLTAKQNPAAHFFFALLCNDNTTTHSTDSREEARQSFKQRIRVFLVLISVHRYANCARWKKFYKNVALSA